MADAARITAELRASISASRRKRVPIDDLMDQAVAVDPALNGDPDWRRLLDSALRELADDGTITFPATESGWDRRGLPALPRWVLRKDAARPALDRPSRRVWPGRLEAAGSIATSKDEHALLDRIARWLRDDPFPERVPVQERSLELFSEEKALDRHLGNRLFTTGALDLDLLACFRPPIPFASQHVAGAGPTHLIVLENSATYTSFLMALRRLSDGNRPDVHVAWGHGNEFGTTIASVPLLSPEPTSLWYFGDLDVSGLRIAAGAAERAEELGLPGLVPLRECYAHLLDGPEEWRAPDISNRGLSADAVPALVSWLPESLRSDATRLITHGRRVPQERVGLSRLTAHPELWGQLLRTHRREAG